MQSTTQYGSPADANGITLSLPVGTNWRQQMVRTASAHWPEYLMEAIGLGLFMVSACAFSVLAEYPGSAVRQAVASALARRAIVGLAMGLTAIALIYSPWGKQSGAHLNPSVTLAFFHLGKISGWDALFYIAAQFAGGVAGVGLASLALGSMLAHESVRYAVTRPGMRGTGIAFAAELAISFVLMTVVLNASNSPAFAHFTGILAGALVATYITVEAPFSGMSMNPARTFGSAFHARMWEALWLYFTAPPMGMILASELFVRTRGVGAVICAKLHHHNSKRCIFRCGYAAPNISASMSDHVNPSLSLKEI